MKKTQLFSIATLVLFLFSLNTPEHSTTTTDLQSTTDPCRMENTTFVSGEEIVYKLFYNWNFVWMSAGEVRFRVKESGDQYHINVTGRSYPSYEWAFKVRDRYDTYIDKETLLPSLSVKTLNEGSYRLYDRTTLDQTSGEIRCMRGKTEEKATLREHTVDACMHDLLSIVYYTRNLDFDQLEKGQRIPVKIFMDEKTYPLSVKYGGKETGKKIKGQGKHNTLLFSPEVVAGEVFKDDSHMHVWVTDDQNRIPLLIESKISVGSIKAVLKSYKGLKYEMTSKLDD